MSKTWLLPIAGLLALVIAAVAIVARFTSRSLESPLVETAAPSIPPTAPAVPPAPVESAPPSETLPPPPPPRVEIKLEDLDSFKALTASPFPGKSEWEGFVARADAVAREQMEKRGIPATAAMRATLEARKKKALQDYEAFTQKVVKSQETWGERTPQIPKEPTAAMATDLVHHRSRLLFLDDRLSRLQ